MWEQVKKWGGNLGTKIKGNVWEIVIAIVSGIIFYQLFSGQFYQRGQFDETLNRGLELLAHEKISTRITGLHLLEELHEDGDTPERQERIRKVMLGFIRQHTRPIEEDPDNAEQRQRKPRPDEDRWDDVEIAIRILGDSMPEDRRKDINLSRLDLRGLNLFNIRLSGANLIGANFSGVDLTYADLTDAHLRKANLSKADLIGANLTGADLGNADLTSAGLILANLNYAHLGGANLTHADLSGADLTRAELVVAHLNDANLDNANLTYANLAVTNLNGANLIDADLTYTDLTGADLRGVYTLTQIQLNKVIYWGGHRPKYVSVIHKIPESRAYERVRDENGRSGKRFVDSKEWIDD